MRGLVLLMALSAHRAASDLGIPPLAEFVEIMAAIGLRYPKFIDHAVPGNRVCGVCPRGVPEDLEDLEQYFERIAHSA